jgi:excisionase family DNA binding protein
LREFDSDLTNPYSRLMKTANPLLVSLDESAFQLSLPREEVVALIREGDLTAVKVREHVLVAYDSLVALTRRAKRNSSKANMAMSLGT